MPTSSPFADKKRTHRLDAPHRTSPIRDVGVSLELDTLSSAAGKNPMAQASQMERQAEQLANEFQQQRCDLDRRESEFNARAARLENELRVARLVYREREVTLQEKQGEFEQSIDKLRQRNADLVAAHQVLESDADEFQRSRTQAMDGIRLSTEAWQKKLRDVELREVQLMSQLAEAKNQKRSCRIRDKNTINGW